MDERKGGKGDVGNRSSRDAMAPWSNLSAASLTFLTEHSSDVVFERGDALGRAVGIVTHGVVGCVVTLSDGRRALAELFQHGDYIDARNLASSISTTDLIALSSGRLRLVEPEASDRGITQYADFAEYVVDQQRQQAARMRSHAVDLACKTPIERLAAVLLELGARRSGGNGEDLSLISISIRRTDLADYLGITPETLSRTLRQLLDEGLIEAVSSEALRVRDRGRLTAIAAGGRPRSPRSARTNSLT